MDFRATELLIRNLSFEVQAVPEKNAPNSKSSNRGAPMNLKVRVRNKDGILNKNTVLTIPNISHPGKADRVKLAGSDQTIMSFNVFMETDLEKKPSKKSNNLFARCFATESDGEEVPYGRTAHTDTKSDTHVTLQKNNNNSADDAEIRKTKLFGKCKPGGCLDPPFGEDKYQYKPRVSENRCTSIKSLGIENVDKDEIVTESQTKNNMRHSDDQVVILPVPVRSPQTLEDTLNDPQKKCFASDDNTENLDILYQPSTHKDRNSRNHSPELRSSDVDREKEPQVTQNKKLPSRRKNSNEDLQSTADETDSLITYPLAISSSDLELDVKKNERKSITKRSSNLSKTRQSSNEFTDKFFLPPRKDKSGRVNTSGSNLEQSQESIATRTTKMFAELPLKDSKLNNNIVDMERSNEKKLSLDSMESIVRLTNKLPQPRKSSDILKKSQYVVTNDSKISDKTVHDMIPIANLVITDSINNLEQDDGRRRPNPDYSQEHKASQYNTTSQQPRTTDNNVVVKGTEEQDQSSYTANRLQPTDQPRTYVPRSASIVTSDPREPINIIYKDYDNAVIQGTEKQNQSSYAKDGLEPLKSSHEDFSVINDPREPINIIDKETWQNRISQNPKYEENLMSDDLGQTRKFLSREDSVVHDPGESINLIDEKTGQNRAHIISTSSKDQILNPQYEKKSIINSFSIDKDSTIDKLASYTDSVIGKYKPTNEKDSTAENDSLLYKKMESNNEDDSILRMRNDSMQGNASERILVQSQEKNDMPYQYRKSSELDYSNNLDQVNKSPEINSYISGSNTDSKNVYPKDDGSLSAAENRTYSPMKQIHESIDKGIRPEDWFNIPKDELDTLSGKGTPPRNYLQDSQKGQADDGNEENLNTSGKRNVWDEEGKYTPSKDEQISYLEGSQVTKVSVKGIPPRNYLQDSQKVQAEDDKEENLNTSGEQNQWVVDGKYTPNKDEQISYVEGSQVIKQRESIFLNFAFQKNVDDASNKVFMKTLDASYPTDNDSQVIVIKTVLNPQSDRVRVPIDDFNELSIKYNKVHPVSSESSRRINFILACPTDRQPANTVHSGTMSLNIKDDRKGDVKSPTQHPLLSLERFGSDLHETLSSIYEKQLVPLQKTIKGLKQDIDFLANQQLLLRGRVQASSSSRRIRPVRMIHSSKRCVCISPRY